MPRNPAQPSDMAEPADLAKAEAAYERFVWDHLPRNFAGHFIHGALGMTGFRLVNSLTIMPAYLSLLSGGSALFVGLGQSLQQLGGVVSPVVGATFVEHRRKVLPVSLVMGVLMRVQVLILALAGFFLHGRPLLFVVLGALFLLGLFSGAQGVAFQLLLAKVIPITRRGALQAVRNMVGGSIAAGLAWWAGDYLVQRNVFGNGYGVTFLIAFFLTSAGLLALGLLMVEPSPPRVRPRTRLAARLREFPSLFVQDRGFMNFMIAQTLATAGRIGVPFYVLFAGRSMSLDGKTVGLLSLISLGADTSTNLLWGLTGDRFGFRFTFILSLAFWIAGTALLMAAPSLPVVHLAGMSLGSVGFILLAFFALGGAQSGFLMSSQTMVLEFGAREDVPMRLALMATGQGTMNALTPLLGGLIAATLGYETLFGFSAVLLAVSLFLLIFLVEEPRLRRAAA